MTAPAKPKKKAYKKKSAKQKVTIDTIADKLAAQIIAQIEQGEATGLGWKKPWKVGKPPRNPVTGTVYKGMNTLILGSHDGVLSTGDTRFVTFHGAKALAAKHLGVTIDEYDAGVKDGIYEPAVIKGSKSTQTHFAAKVPKKDPTPEDPSNKKMVFAWRTNGVFHLSTEVNPKYVPADDSFVPSGVEPAEAVTALYEAFGVDVEHGGDAAYYMPSKHHIRLPHPGKFATADGYAHTAIHELCHWTKGDGLDRKSDHGEVGGSAFFGTAAYAREEIRTEMAAAIVCAELGIGVDESGCHDDSQTGEYVASWVGALKANPTEITDAARDAQRIADHIIAKIPAHHRATTTKAVPETE